MLVHQTCFHLCVSGGAGAGVSEEAAAFCCWQQLFSDQRGGQHPQVVCSHCVKTTGCKAKMYVCTDNHTEVSGCACVFQTEDWRFRGRTSAFGGEEQQSGDETGETQPTGRHQNFPPAVFCDGLTRVAQRNQFNNPKGSSLACMTLLIDLHKWFPYLPQLDPVWLHTVEPLADLKPPCYWLRGLQWPPQKRERFCQNIC